MEKLFRVLILILVVASLMPVAAQDTIMIHWSNNKTQINFLNSSGKTVKHIPLEETNPYKLNFKPVYTGTHKLNFSYNSEAFTAGKGFTIITHRVQVYEVEVPDKGGYQLQELGESTVVVFDKLGTEIFRDTIHADNASQSRITDDGKLASVSFAEGVYGQSARRTGTSIYDLTAGSLNLIAQIPIHSSHSWLMGDFFVYSEWDPERFIYYAFNIRDKVLRSKTYTRTEANLIKRLDKTGIVFMVPPDKERKERFDSFTRIK